MTYISLLRGINVSGQKLIKMDQLRGLYESLQFGHVRSYIQSGNVIFTSSEENESGLMERISSAIQDAFGYQVTVLLRTAGELQQVVDANPFLRDGNHDPKKLHAVFLAEEPGSSMLREIEKVKSGGEDVKSLGRELYLYLPAGSGRTKLTNVLFERKLKMPATTRNWRTVTILADMAMQTQEMLTDIHR